MGTRPLWSCTAEDIAADLESIARWGLPAGLLQEIRGLVSRYGKLMLEREADGEGDALCLTAAHDSRLDKRSRPRHCPELMLDRISPVKPGVRLPRGPP
ncbi:hypothetical protein VQ056_19410 [Paenibacillus sp. JTLBN-2024]